METIMQYPGGYPATDFTIPDGGNNREIIGLAIVVVLIAVIGVLYAIRPR